MAEQTEIRALLMEIHTDVAVLKNDVARHMNHAAQTTAIVTGGERPEDGLQFQVAELRRDAANQRERTTFWFRTLGASIIATIITMLSSLFSFPKGTE